MSQNTGIIIVMVGFACISSIALAGITPTGGIEVEGLPVVRAVQPNAASGQIWPNPVKTEQIWPMTIKYYRSKDKPA